MNTHFCWAQMKNLFECKFTLIGNGFLTSLDIYICSFDMVYFRVLMNLSYNHKRHPFRGAEILHHQTK